jgi:hypothetical protein
VIQRRGESFPIDQSRVAYLRYLRREHRRSPRTEADVAHVAAKTEMLQLRLMEKRRELVPGRISMQSSTDLSGSFSRI